MYIQHQKHIYIYINICMYIYLNTNKKSKRLLFFFSNKNFIQTDIFLKLKRDFYDVTKTIR